MAALIVQVRWRDRAHQLVERRLPVDRVIRIDIAHARTRLGNTAELDVLRSFAVPAKWRARLARRHVRKRFGQSGARDYWPDAGRSYNQEPSARYPIVSGRLRHCTASGDHSVSSLSSIVASFA